METALKTDEDKKKYFESEEELDLKYTNWFIG